ncbi:hypothetical protein [Parasitella parasitica]|uniref:FFD box profile domain-containing protein n=1 Tax=Parasitella parasitica TaxID=35722 RepID=A0A0B7NK37_9FUNG|nr:hypothetical protein [Parasitella parasitica]
MSGQNYIGSKISLISLSDIRYVGILHNINPVESTVALQNVKSYGTEGRKDNPNEEILPTDNTFDYVVFRGSDIKDLQVFEAPPSFQPEQTQKPMQQQQQQPQFAEPVAPYTYPSAATHSYYPTQQTSSNNKSISADYVAASYSNTANYWQGNGNVPSSQTLYNPYLQQNHFPMPVPENYQTAPSAPPAAALLQELSVNENGISPPSSKKEYKEDEEKTFAPPKKQAPAVNLAPTSMKTKVSQEKEEVAAPVIEQVDEILLNSLVKQVSDLDIKHPTIASKQKVSGKSQKQQQPPQASNETSRSAESHRGNSSNGTRGAGAGTGGGGRRSSGRNLMRNNSTRTNGNGNNTWEPNGINHRHKNTITSGHRNSSGNIHRRNSGIVIPKSDFDFESSNAKFDKNSMNSIEDMVGSNDENVVIPEPDHFYDKKKSFFDDISCESKEYQEGNRTGKYKEESKLNLETFGQANPVGQNGKRGRRSRHHRSNGRSKSTSLPHSQEIKQKSN